MAEAEAAFRPWGETRFRTKNHAEFHALKLAHSKDGSSLPGNVRECWGYPSTILDFALPKIYPVEFWKSYTGIIRG